MRAHWKQPKQRFTTDIRNEIHFESVRLRSTNPKSHHHHHLHSARPVLNQIDLIDPVPVLDRPLTTARIDPGPAHIIYAHEVKQHEPSTITSRNSNKKIRNHRARSNSLASAAGPTTNKRSRASAAKLVTGTARPVAIIDEPVLSERAVLFEPDMNGGFTPMIPTGRSLPIWTEFHPLDVANLPPKVKPPTVRFVGERIKVKRPRNKSRATISAQESTSTTTRFVFTTEASATSPAILPNTERIVSFLNQSHSPNTFKHESIIPITLRVPTGIPKAATSPIASSTTVEPESVHKSKSLPLSSSSSSSTVLPTFPTHQLNFGDLSSSSYAHLIHVIPPKLGDTNVSGKLHNHQLGIVDLARNKPSSSSHTTNTNHLTSLMSSSISSSSSSSSFNKPSNTLSSNTDHSAQAVDEAILSHVLSLISSNEAPPEVQTPATRTLIKPKNRKNSFGRNKVITTEPSYEVELMGSRN